jgi:bisphosphoglycerate-dependent phosphoglycerate mutase
MSERIYRTPRTYGSPTGYDTELSHLGNRSARLAEALLQAMACANAYRDFEPVQLVNRANDIAAAMLADWETRGWMIEIEDAPNMKRDYGAERGSAEPSGSGGKGIAK